MKTPIRTLDEFLAAVKEYRPAGGSVNVMRFRIEDAIIKMGEGTVAKRRRLAVRIAAWAWKVWQSEESIP